MTTAYRFSPVRSASGELKVWSTILKSLKGMRNRLLKIQTFITRHYIILTSLLYRVRMTSRDTEESENSPESPFGEIKHLIFIVTFPPGVIRMNFELVAGASPFFRTRRGRGYLRLTPIEIKTQRIGTLCFFWGGLAWETIYFSWPWMWQAYPIVNVLLCLLTT